VKITGAAASKSPVPLCKIDGVIGKEINFSIWLPDAWNGKFVMGGQGGFAGRVESQTLGMGVLQKGYATAGTDTGHSGPAGSTDGAWAIGDMERIVDHAHAAIHRVTVTSKSIVQSRYGRAPERSYFAGCSNGGREALQAAQRYPNDFDGIRGGCASDRLPQCHRRVLQHHAEDVPRSRKSWPRLCSTSRRGRFCRRPCSTSATRWTG